MSKNETEYSLAKLKQALIQLQDAIIRAADGDELKQDGALQRFEFTFELMWKTLKVYLAYLGKPCTSPRDTLKEAFKQQLLKTEQPYLDMLDDRNLCSHTYDFDTTRRVFDHLKGKYFQAIQDVADTVRKKL